MIRVTVYLIKINLYYCEPFLSDIVWRDKTLFEFAIVLQIPNAQIVFVFNVMMNILSILQLDNAKVLA